MSRWVRCSYGKRAGFVGAKIDIIIETSKIFGNFFILLYVLCLYTTFQHTNVCLQIVISKKTIKTLSDVCSSFRAFVMSAMALSVRASSPANPISLIT